MKNKTKLAFDLLELEMEVIHKEDQIMFKGGDGGAAIDEVGPPIKFTWAEFMYAVNHGDLSKFRGNYVYGDDGTLAYFGGDLDEVVIKNNYKNTQYRGWSEGAWTNEYCSIYGRSGNPIELAGVTISNYTIGGSCGSSSGYYGGSYYGGGAPSSDLRSTSAFLGYTSLYLEKTGSLLHYTAEEATALADIANALKATKVLVQASKSIGVAGALMTGYEGFSDADGFTWGDGAKVGIGLIATFTPYGWAYGVVDLATGVITGTTLTDSLGYAIDNGF